MILPGASGIFCVVSRELAWLRATVTVLAAVSDEMVQKVTPLMTFIHTKSGPVLPRSVKGIKSSWEIIPFPLGVG